MTRVLSISPVAKPPSQNAPKAKRAVKAKPRTTVAELEEKMTALIKRIDTEPPRRAEVPREGKIAAWALGIIMPVFSVGFTAIAGTLASAGRPVWWIVAFAAAAGLAVSLRHITLAISIATRAPKYEAFLLAIGFELGVVGIELANVTAPDVIFPALGYGLMAFLAAVVAALNVFAFLSQMDGEPSVEA